MIFLSGPDRPRAGSKQAPLLAFFDSHGLVETATGYVMALVRRRKLAWATIKRYAQGVQRYLEFLDAHTFLNSLYPTTDLKVLNATRLDVDTWLAQRRDSEGATDQTRSVEETAVRGLYKYLGDPASGYRIRHHPYKKDPTRTTRVPAGDPQNPLNEDQIISILRGFHNEGERAMFQFAYDAGCRVDGLCTLTRGAIADAHAYFKARDSQFRYVPILIPQQKKGGDEPAKHLCWIAVPTLLRVVAYHGSDDYADAPGWAYRDRLKPAFLTCNGHPWRYSNAYGQLRQASQRQNVRLTEGRRASPHTFRRSSAYARLASSDHGKDRLDRLVATWNHLGHSCIGTTQMYVRLPFDVMESLSVDTTVYDSAKRIWDATRLPQAAEHERRGHYPRKRRAA